MLLDKPYFTLNVNMADCVYELIFNGVYVHTELDCIPLISEFPVNHWMAPQHNVITLNLYFDHDNKLPAGARCDVTLCVRAVGAPMASRLVLSRVHYSHAREQGGIGTVGSTEAGAYDSAHLCRPDPAGDIKVAAVVQAPLPEGQMPGITLTQEIAFASALPAWGFLDGDELPELAALMPREQEQWHRELFAQYSVMQAALSHGQVDMLVTMCAQRNRELDAAFFLEPGTRAAALRAALLDATTAGDQELLALAPDYVGMETMPNGKLTRMVRASGGPAIVFNYKHDDISRSFDFIFGRQDGRWVVYR